jgi:hypothetical protein
VTPFRSHGVPVGRVLSSPWCRCLETARLAFGADAEVSRPLSNLYGRSEASARQVREMETLISTWRPEGAGGNLVMVSPRLHHPRAHRHQRRAGGDWWC